MSNQHDYIEQMSDRRTYNEYLLQRDQQIHNAGTYVAHMRIKHALFSTAVRKK
jgi:hypothetical protein